MGIDDVIEPTTQSKFQTEMLFRLVKECDDIEMLRDIALQLVDLHQKKSAIANWATKQAAKAEIKSFSNNKKMN